MYLVDSHTHLVSFARRGNAGDAIMRAVEAGVERMVTVGTEPDDWSINRDLAASHPGVIDYTVGLHPTSVDDQWEAALAALPEALDWEPRPVGLGEMGLDRFHLPGDPDEAARIFARQENAFRAQLDLARGTAWPLVIHSRGAVEACVEMIDESGVDWTQVVFHCFSDGPELLAPILERGGRASFTGIVTYKNAEKVRESLKRQPLDRLMFETDAPYLAPVPKRGKPNEPAYVRYIAEFCAEILGMSEENLATLTTKNAKAFYDLK
ncbi:MAG: TatD family deoxyribonuclease [Verrucomicrobia bacterium]|nr:MAG: TatD family deoxyribonuclease [Verrucomicrobiota bacterium]